MSSTRVCIIGAGALGLSTALELVRRGADVTVVDMGYPASGSTGLAVGIVTTQQLEPLEIALRAMSMRAFARLEPHGLAVNRIGYVRLGRSADAMEAFAQSASIQGELGIKGAAVLDTHELQSLVPDLSCHDLEGALYGSDDGYIDGHLFCQLLAELITDAGGQIWPKSRLRRAERTEGGHRLWIGERTCQYDAVVNAAGGWAESVARILGHELTIIPERHEAVVVGLPQELSYTMPFVMDYVPGHGGTGLNFRHERRDQLIAEVHAPHGALVVDPDAFAGSVDLDSLEHLAGLLLERLPRLSGAGLGRGWAGVYPESRDGRAYVGPMGKDATAIAVAGAGGYGIQLAPALGALGADWIINGDPVSLPEARVLTPARHEYRIGWRS